jgi:hypothetical protein
MLLADLPPDLPLLLLATADVPADGEPLQLPTAFTTTHSMHASRHSPPSDRGPQPGLACHLAMPGLPCAPEHPACCPLLQSWTPQCSSCST